MAKKKVGKKPLKKKAAKRVFSKGKSKPKKKVAKKPRKKTVHNKTLAIVKKMTDKQIETFGLTLSLSDQIELSGLWKEKGVAFWKMLAELYAEKQEELAALKILEKMPEKKFQEFYEQLPYRVRLMIEGRMVDWKSVLPSWYLRFQEKGKMASNIGAAGYLGLAVASGAAGGTAYAVTSDYLRRRTERRKGMAGNPSTRRKIAEIEDRLASLETNLDAIDMSKPYADEKYEIIEGQMYELEEDLRVLYEEQGEGRRKGMAGNPHKPGEKHVLLRDNRILFKGTVNECYAQLLKVQSSSIHHAMTHEGYKIIPAKEIGPSHYRMPKAMSEEGFVYNPLRGFIGRQMETGKLPSPYTIKVEDVGRYIDIDFGRVVPSDIGRKIYLRGGIIQMESKEQQAKRLSGRRHGNPYKGRYMNPKIRKVRVRDIVDINELQDEVERAIMQYSPEDLEFEPSRYDVMIDTLAEGWEGINQPNLIAPALKLDLNEELRKADLTQEEMEEIGNWSDYEFAWEAIEDRANEIEDELNKFVDLPGTLYYGHHDVSGDYGLLYTWDKGDHPEFDRKG